MQIYRSYCTSSCGTILNKTSFVIFSSIMTQKRSSVPGEKTTDFSQHNKEQRTTNLQEYDSTSRPCNLTTQNGHREWKTCIVCCQMTRENVQNMKTLSYTGVFCTHRGRHAQNLSKKRSHKNTRTASLEATTKRYSNNNKIHLSLSSTKSTTTCPVVEQTQVEVEVLQQ